ncbi:superoxide dismutase [Duganella sp. Leaf126]|uniref:superoxide dismutase family protein n=1 Tax=Duganella sp. Leaf126 TaxID=1736266 RepID=UPI0006F9ABD0|nr:superoxide dismutase family protein [Duganella sp. Leaf126]KQQ45080.1 superoxide dismutase [Duganella sp. Leaf126]
MKTAVLSCILALAAIQTASAAIDTAKVTAEAKLAPTANSKTSGLVTFEQTAAGVHVKAKVEGLTPGLHGFHIHEKGDCSAPDGSSAGGHFNPTSAPHGDPTHSSKHSGDFGNITADANGVAMLDVTVPLSQLTLTEGSPVNALNRGVIVHTAPDDLKTQPTGNAGGRLACGVIRATR